ncbi:MAG: glutaredoxin 3 [Myxococcales bacterium]|nr:glutaredoxin 3 [Myxococcales bacterium]
MADVVIYTKHFCSYCVRAKALLAKKGVAFHEIDVSRDPAMRRWLTDVTGQSTVPQIFINGQSVGGCDDLHELDRFGELDALLQAPSRDG